MKTILTLVTSVGFVLLTNGCAIGSMPAFPEKIVDHYLVEVRDEEIPESVVKAIENLDEIPAMSLKEVARCLKFEVISRIPYKIKFVSEVQMKDCNGVGGYKPSDFVSLINWISDVAAWAETRKKCFK